MDELIVKETIKERDFWHSVFFRELKHFKMERSREEGIEMSRAHLTHSDFQHSWITAHQKCSDRNAK